MRYVPGSWVALTRPDGWIVFSTGAPPGDVARMHPDPAILRLAASTGKPQVADLEVSPFSKSLAAYVEVPVRR